MDCYDRRGRVFVVNSDGGWAPKARSRSQTIDGNPTWVMYVGGYVWYLELFREPKHVAQ